MPGIGVVLNPKSRRNLRDPLAASRLARTLGDQGVVREARSVDELYRIAADFRRDDIEILAISGGDGTNHVTLTGFLDVYNFDVRRVMKCCLAHVLPSGHVVPFCAYNTLYRDGHLPLPPLVGATRRSLELATS